MLYIYFQQISISFILKLFYQNIICHILYLAKNVSFYNIIFYNIFVFTIPYACAQIDAIFGSLIYINFKEMDFYFQIP